MSIQECHNLSQGVAVYGYTQLGSHSIQIMKSTFVFIKLDLPCKKQDLLINLFLRDGWLKNTTIWLTNSI